MFYFTKCKIKSQLLHINNEKALKRFLDDGNIEIDNNASETRVRFQRVEGYEPIPVAVIGGMKFFSPIIDSKIVDISIGFNEYNVVFLKAINTENNLATN